MRTVIAHYFTVTTRLKNIMHSKESLEVSTDGW